jgi:cyclopropane-fatty-acyl-phospholipid synthase
LLGDLICLKLQIEPRDRVLEMGCACGGFAIYAVRNYDARVTGVTISRAQYDYAAERIAKADLVTGSVALVLVLEDYRKLEGEYDKIASVEMFEGFDHYDEFFGGSDRLLAVWRDFSVPGGCAGDGI